MERRPCYNSIMPDTDFFCYLTHSDEDEKWQMVCTDTGMTHILPDTIYPPRLTEHPVLYQTVSVGRRLNDYQIVYISNGRGSLEMGDQKHELSAGSLFLLFPGISHAYRPDPETGWTEYWVGFSGPYADSMVTADILNPDQPVFHPGYQASLVSVFHEIIDLVRQQTPLYQFRVCAGIMRILAETLSLERLSVQQTRAQEIVEQAKSFIDRNIRTTFDLEKLGATLHLSIPQLNEVFKSYTGMTPYQYCIHAKINRAKEILASGESSIKEIAWQVGFDDPYYFSRLFKKKTGYSPSSWITNQCTP